MPDEQNDETTEQPTEASEQEAVDAAAQEPSEAPAEEAGTAPPAEPAADAAPAEQLHPKESRRRARSQHSGEARPQRSPEDRQAERLAKRARNAAERRRWRTKRREKRRAAGPREGTAPAQRSGTGSRRERLGVVISDKADKTISVRIDVARPHRTYGKIVRSSSTLHAHDERNEASAGDTVRVVESRPLSASKRWRLVEILERAR